MREALAFLTPFPGARQPSPRALRWFPLVGALLGLLLGGLWWATAKIWPLPLAAVVVVVADLAFTGMLHVDGLADSADGLLPHLTRERRLAVMREPTIGAYGAAVVAVTLLARWAVFATLRPAPLLVAGLWCASRTAMAAVVDRVPYARAEGETSLVSAFMGSRLPAWLAGLSVGVAAAAAGVWSLPAGTVAVVAGLVAFGAVTALARHRLGGYTGDVLGAAGLIGESVGLLVAAAKW
ncbi:MAG TPA: adenosylcobinamide-GDP ribazoletransferase [Acidimicrobiales bacterium]|nr:adenosylcobinamide-GDP ribazoletransferase [Acidimicrobiales bacterium]